ncbi:hypothetical protein TGRH88_051550 [Toxoplasma gondii]|uniref:Uncharacterized protein n=1 Tax=Toxoplasma gondii TaxID=5811 RepID=A0A7J6JW22_TOXGO|nr:hypothetical protein TGRH88_051550 [Toxoplasma gondii]
MPLTGTSQESFTPDMAQGSAIRSLAHLLAAAEAGKDTKAERHFVTCNAPRSLPCCQRIRKELGILSKKATTESVASC